ncbi:MAG: hypothetical protein QXT75_05720 [Desulfurococcaceae archaeon]
MREVIAVIALVIALISPTTLSSHAIIVRGETSLDCGFLIALLNLELNYAINYNTSSGVALAQAALNMSLPSEIAVTHRQVYQAFLNYFKALEELETIEYTNTSIIQVAGSLIRSREVFANTLNKYVDTLVSCTVNKDAASKLRNNVLSLKDTFLSTIYPSVIYSLLSKLKGPELVIIELPKSIFGPGEDIPIYITPIVEELSILKIEIAHWPTLRKLAELSNYTRVNNSYYVEYRAPYLNEVGNLVVGNSVQLAVVVTFTLHNITSSYAKPFEVVYEYPDVSIVLKPEIEYGSELPLNIVSNTSCNATVLINNVRVLYATILPGVNTYTIPFNTTVFRIGYNSLRVVIDETPRTLGYTVEKTFLVKARSPGIYILTPTILVGWSNSVQVVMVNHYENQVNLTMLINNKEVLNVTLKDRVYNLNIALNSPFFTTLEIDVYAINDHGVKIPIFRKEILYINGLSLAALTAATILAVSIIKGEVLVLLGSDSSARRRLTNYVVSSRSPPLKPGIVYNIMSKIASIYYGLLSKLGLPQPELNETLREHYRKLKLKDNLATVLWRLLILVERDLYSNRKPSYKEVLEAVEEVEKNAGE